MYIESSRREVLFGLAAASLGGLTAGLAGSAPAHAGVGWGTGPNSGLPFWLGANGDYSALLGLMRPGQSVDLVNLWESSNTYLADADKNAPVPVRNYPRGWSTLVPHKSFLATGQASAVQWSSSPFCSGSAFVVPSSWPTRA